jgi:hypothetical protein
MGMNLRKEHTFRVVEKKLLNTIFGTKRMEEWKKLHNEELHNLYTLTTIAH